MNDADVVGGGSDDAYVVGLAAATLINIGHTSDGLEYVSGPHGGGGWGGAEGVELGGEGGCPSIGPAADSSHTALYACLRLGWYSWVCIQARSSHPLPDAWQKLGGWGDEGLRW